MRHADLLFQGKVTELDALLTSAPSIANTNIPLPDNASLAHPLHRICDAVFSKVFSEKTGIEIAKVFLKHGSAVNPSVKPGEDSPLTAACSLRCDDIALLYLEHGANIHHPGCHGGTALHWSAWCGRDHILQKLLTLNPEINLLCTDFKSTPLFWAIHGYKFGDASNRHHQQACATLLLEHGADPTIPNFEGYLPVDLLGPDDDEIKKVFG